MSTQILPTASVAKVDILMAVLLEERWAELPRSVRKDAEVMIRVSATKRPIGSGSGSAATLA